MSETAKTHILLFLFFFTMFCSQAFARKANPSSLVFGMAYSGTLIAPKVTSSAMRKQSNTNSIEPMKEVRDGYLISLNLGTPSQVVQVYMDTGSDLTWVPCGNLSFNCIECDSYFRTNNFTGSFSPSSSSTSVRVPCISSFCSKIHSSDTSFDPCTMSGCSLTALMKGTCLRPCPSFAYTYGEGGVVTGALTKDTLRIIHDTNPINSITEFPKFRFGCVWSSYKEPLGIAGFGKGLLSLPSQLGFLQKGFSHCFTSFKYSNNPNVSSPLIIGDLAISSSNDTYQFTPLLTNPTFPNYYYIELESITIGNQPTKELPFSFRAFDSKGDGGMMIDSGTTYTHLPEPFYSDLLEEVRSVVPYPRATDLEEKTSFDLCYNVPCPNNTCMVNGDDDDVLPMITFHFLGNVSVVLPEDNNFYAVSPPRNGSVVKCLLYQGMEEGDLGPAAVFGSFQQQNLEVVYDLERERIGFKQMDCAAFAASLGLHKVKS